MNFLRTRKVCTAMAAVFFAMSSSIYAQAADNYPTKPVQIVLPIAPGGDTDINARLFSKYLQEELGQSVAIINVDGAGGTIGMRRVKDAKPDGYTALFFHNESLVPKIAGISDMGLDDFKMAAIAIIDNSTILVTHKDAPFSDMKELDQYAVNNPDKLTFGMLIGGVSHIIGAALNNELKSEATMIDIGGNSAKIVALRGKKVDFINVQYQLVKDYLKSGEFINLGLLSPERNPVLPDIATTTEQGYPMNFDRFFYFAMPKDTPDEIVNKFSEAIKNVVNNKDYIEEAKSFYLTPTYMDPQEATSYVEEQYESLLKYKDLLRN